jgi:hypothetical protein
LAADQHLRLAAGAQEKPAGLFMHNTSAGTPVRVGLWSASILVARGPPGWNQRADQPDQKPKQKTAFKSQKTALYESHSQQAAKIHNDRQQATPRVGELLLLYVDDSRTDVTPSGDVRDKAFRIMPEEKLRSTGKLLTETPVSQMDL